MINQGARKLHHAQKQLDTSNGVRGLAYASHSVLILLATRLRLSEPLTRDSVENLPSEQQLSELQLLTSLDRPRRDPPLEEWLALPIRTPKGQRLPGKARR